MTVAKNVEIKSLFDRRAFEVFFKEELLFDGNILPGCFVLVTKSSDDGKVKYKARLVIGGHCNNIKELTMQLTSILQLQSVRFLLALS